MKKILRTLEAYEIAGDILKDLFLDPEKENAIAARIVAVLMDDDKKETEGDHCVD